MELVSIPGAGAHLLDRSTPVGLVSILLVLVLTPLGLVSTPLELVSIPVGMVSTPVGLVPTPKGKVSTIYTGAGTYIHMCTLCRAGPHLLGWYPHPWGRYQHLWSWYPHL
jgi:hypothetical protein